MNNMQVAPYPMALEELVRNLEYKDKWEFVLRQINRGQGSEGLTLSIRIATPDSYNHKFLMGVVHYFPVPPAAYEMRSWRRWLLDCILLVERHEACEFFTIGGDKPYAPSHGPGNDPYMIREVGTDLDRRTSFKGEVKQEPTLFDN